MSQVKTFFIPIVIFIFCLQGCIAQTSVQSKILPLISTIALPVVSGRIDHLAIDPVSQRIFIAALGNNSIEVVDLKSNNSIFSIKNLNEPQGIVFIRENNTVFVANGGNGKCDIFNATTFQKIKTIQLSGDADNIRYDSIHKKLYVGYGNGGIAIINAVTFKQEADIKLQGHPESFQLDIAAGKIYVNVPDKHQVEIIDLNKSIVIDRWELTKAKSNFPMALDAINHRLFIGCRRPAKLLVLNTETGNVITELKIDNDVDDIFLDSKNGNLYLSCGSGYIDICKQNSADRYTLIEKIPTRSGARTSLFIPQLNRLIIASPKNFGSDAALLIYSL